MIPAQAPLFPELPPGLDPTFCDKCSIRMPPGQTGCCEDCGRTEFSFDELSDQAKQRAREEYTSGDYPEYDWWFGVYEDVVYIGEILGIHTSVKNIYFSGFWSQGDGANFSGNYRFNPEACTRLIAERNDAELIRIANELAVMQTTFRLHGGEVLRGKISDERHHNVNVVLIDDEDLDDKSAVDEKDLQALMQDFANWIYKNLEAEYTYQTSDDFVDEELRASEQKFDELGRVL